MCFYYSWTAVLQMIRFAIETHAFDTSNLKKLSGNYLKSGEYNMGNCVLVHKKNGISTFPFVFGNRLYLYDTELHQLFTVVTERDGEKDFYQGGMESYMTEGSGD